MRARRLLSAILSCALAATAAAGETVEYTRDVRPILADHCFACHGPDGATREAKLRLDRRDDAIADRGGYAAVVPFDADSSELVARIMDEGDPMPPGSEHERLSDDQIDVLRRWIAEGAPYDVHWAYEPPGQPEPPPVRVATWPRTSVDRFVLARLEESGVTPAPRADARTLVRRLSFDLLGLPPDVEAVEAFARDPSDAAWDGLVEELLASPHHAERLATFWFDLVRFADTTGIHADNRWNISPYRDWVIDAFHRNMPFDRFTVEQLAGDLLPNATLDQKVAAAYNRLNLITREGGSQAKEFLVRYTADRVRNVSEVWLATTLGCAQCHDHKFDPLSTREFYEMGAFFADIEQAGVYSENQQNHFVPELEVPSADQAAEVARLATELATVEAQLAADSSELAADQRAWEERLAGERWIQPEGIVVETDRDTVLTRQEDGSFLATGGDAERDTYRVSFDVVGGDLRALRLELLADASLPQQGPGRAGNGNLVLSELEVAVGGEPVPIVTSSASFEQPNFPVARAHDGEHGRSGWAVLRGSRGTPAEAVFELATPIAAPSQGTRRVELALHQDHGSRHVLGRFRLSWSSSVGRQAVDPALRAALHLPVGGRTDDDRVQLRAMHRATTPLLAAERALRAELSAGHGAAQAAIPLVMATRRVEPMMTRILPRGNWMDDSGDVVAPGVPAALGPVLEGESRLTRLDLANWLVDGRNPLVARVLVNRIWRVFFGRGLVATLDDFGVQGVEPTHPALLDHLATELVTSGWNVRHVIRLIVRSSAYAQASIADSGQDPANTWFGRQERFRLDAEFVRDNALAASGLLVRTVGGPSVRPYQPVGYWAHLNFPKRTYRPSTGDDLYRRALYGHWQRQYLHPSLLAFDAPSRERCTAERPRSNTPQAALALLNDPIFVEAARALAERVLHTGGTTDEERARFLWRRVLQREPRESERRLIQELVTEHREHYRAHPEDARRLLGVGERAHADAFAREEYAAWTSAARVALNLHETIVRS